MFLRSLGITLLMGLTSLALADNIHLKRGAARLNVKVTEDTYQKVMYKEEGRDHPIPIAPENVEWIEYDDAPREFGDGRNAFEIGDYENAVSFFKEALELAKTSGVGEWLQNYAHFYLAQSYQKWGETTSFDAQKYQDSIQFYQKTLQVAPNSRFIFACYLQMAQCYLASKNYTAAKEQLHNLQTLAKEQTKDPQWLFLAALWQGHVAVAETNYSNAVVRYKDAETVTLPKGQEHLRNEASLAIGDCYITQKDFASAQRHFEKIEKESSSNNWELLAGAKNGLATAMLEEGLQALEKNEAETAYSFLHKAKRLVIEAIVNYPGATTQQARSFFIAATCYEKLTAQDPASLGRAKAYYQFLYIAHANTDWGRKAARLLQKLKNKGN